MAVNVEELPDGLIIHGSLRATSHGRRATIHLDGRSDHRIVMALAPAGLAVDSRCIIDTAEAMNVTFPEYVNLMKTLGADMKIK